MTALARFVALVAAFGPAPLLAEAAAPAPSPTTAPLPSERARASARSALYAATAPVAPKPFAGDGRRATIGRRLAAVSDGEDSPSYSSADTMRRLVLPTAMDEVDVHQLRELLDGGEAVACCGFWRNRAASQLQRRVASELRIPMRRLGDVHLSNSSSKITSSTNGSGAWGAVAVLYLDESPVDVVAPLARAVLERAPAARVGAAGGGTMYIDATPGTLVMVPDGDELLHHAPRRVAWLHIRREGHSQLNLFDYYFVAWVRANFVAPYDTEAQRRLFGSFTRYPRYWHGFLWSFIGMFLTVFACLPLAWRAMHFVERLYAPEDVQPAHCHEAVPTEVLKKRLPTLLSNSGPGFKKNHPFHADPLRKGTGQRPATEPLV